MLASSSYSGSAVETCQFQKTEESTYAALKLLCLSLVRAHRRSRAGLRHQQQQQHISITVAHASVRSFGAFPEHEGKDLGIPRANTNPIDLVLIDLQQDILSRSIKIDLNLR